MHSDWAQTAFPHVKGASNQTSSGTCSTTYASEFFAYVQTHKTQKMLTLDSGKITDAGLRELKELKGLQQLSLYSERITDAGLRELKEIKSLQKLTLGSDKITDAGLRELKELKSLQRIMLGSDKITDAAVRNCRTHSPK